jgi:hypothetical protein
MEDMGKAATRFGLLLFCVLISLFNCMRLIHQWLLFYLQQF